MQVLWPAFAMFALTLFVALRLATLRAAAVKARQVDPGFYKTYRDGREPERVAATSRHFSNLFEAPVLFYAAVLIAYVTEQTGALPVALAWGYVAARCMHTWVHLGSNDVLLRFKVFGVSWLFLAALWVVLALGLAGAI